MANLLDLGVEPHVGAPKSGGPLFEDVHRKMKTGISGVLDGNHSATSSVGPMESYRSESAPPEFPAVFFASSRWARRFFASEIHRLTSSS